MEGQTDEIACVPGAIPAGERARHFALARELLSKRALERRDLPKGYAFRFQAEDLEDVTRFVGNERKCCPFVDFDISLSREPRQLWLRMSGPPGTRAVLAAELSLQVQSGCDCHGRPK